MKSHFSFVNKIGLNQNFVFDLNPKSLLSLWKEVSKRKKKRKFILYLKLFNKQKRKAFRLKSFQSAKFSLKTFDRKGKNTDSIDVNDAHKTLFKKHQTKPLPSFPFYTTKNLEVFKSIRHNGYNVHGEIIWHHSKN